jgi:hypothetical protein
MNVLFEEQYWKPNPCNLYMDIIEEEEEEEKMMMKMKKKKKKKTPAYLFCIYYYRCISLLLWLLYCIVSEYNLVIYYIKTNVIIPVTDDMTFEMI